MKHTFQKIFLNAALLTMVFLILCVPPVLAQELNVAIIDSGARAYADFYISFTNLSAKEDPLNHGTEIAKLIRRGDPTAKIYMLQVCEYGNKSLKPSKEAIWEAIHWSVENNIDVVNMSLVTKYDKEIEEAIAQAASRHGLLFIVAAGNKTIVNRFAADQSGYMRKVSQDTKPAFPASLKYVISVGAVDAFNKIASYSDKTCDVYANGKIMGQEGTSFSCARITAQVLKILNEHPHLRNDLTQKEAILSYLK